MDKLDPATHGASKNIVQDNIEKLKELFPDAFVEGKVDFDALKETLGEYADERPERYSFNWNGKARARRIAQTPSTGTLRPRPEQSVDWDGTRNLFIEGDNLEVLKLLQKSYHKKVKILYLDPPYNTGKEFIYPDKFQENLDTYLKYTGQTDDRGFKVSANTETSGRFHTNWLNMMYPRIKLARNLLREDGVCFISIDDNEMANLRKLCDEIFGEENFVECITWNKRVPKNDKGIGNIHEYVLLYVKDASLNHEFTMPKEGLRDIDELLAKLKKSKTPIPEAEAQVRLLYAKKGYDRGITLYNSLNDDYELWGKINVSWPNAETYGPRYDVLHPETGKPVAVPDRGWRWKKETFDEKLDYENCRKLPDGTFMCGEIWFDKDETTQPSSIKKLKDVDTLLLRSILSLKSDGGIEVEKLFESKNYYSYPKPVALIRLLLQSVPREDGDLVLDFFAGSGTTAQAVLELNRDSDVQLRYMLVQLPEPAEEKSEAFKAGYRTLSSIGLERIRRASKKIESSMEDDARGDLGFRLFSLDSSNIIPWDADFDNLEHALFSAAENIKPERSEADVLYEILLKYGLDLAMPVETRSVDEKNVFVIDDGALVICLDRDITPAIAEYIASLKGELKPGSMRVVFKDTGFADDVVKTNVAQILKGAGIDDVKSV